MEENKQILEFIAPEVKVINITPQSRILQDSQTEPTEAPIRADALYSYDKVYF